MLATTLLLTSLAHAAPEAPDDVELGPRITDAYIADVNRKWRGVGIGLDTGAWGSSYASGIKVDVPFGRRLGQFMGVRVRTTTLFANSSPDAGAWVPTNTGGLELFGRGPVMLGIARVYGGGGVHVGIDADHEPAVGGGGHFGLEALVARRASFTFEVGGQGGPGALDVTDGASVMAGLTVYLGDLGNKR